MPSFSNRKAQFFILTAVVIIGLFYGLSRYVNPFSFIDTSAAVRGDETFFFDNVKEKTTKTVQISAAADLEDNMREFKEFAQKVASENGYVLSYSYDVGSQTVNVSMTLRSQKTELKSDFIVQRP